MVFSIVTGSFFHLPICASENNETIATLTIFAANNGSSSFGNTSGHAWISVKNARSYTTLEVGPLYLGPNNECTFGTFNLRGADPGLWFNLESYWIYYNGDYSNRVSLSINITQSDLNTINSLLETSDNWTAINNCSSLAVRIWNAVADSSLHLSAGVPNAPSNLMNSIRSKSSYQTGRVISFSYPVGYMSNGIFHSVSQSNIPTSLVDDYPIA